MNHKRAFTIREDKLSVQEFYVQIIFKSLEAVGYTCTAYNTFQEAMQEPKDTVFVSISHYSTAKMYFKGYKKQIYWVQGSSPDESFMRNHSYVRKWVISAIEYFALQKAKLVFMVSRGMLEHYMGKYHKDYSSKTYIMPCYNSQIDKSLFMTPRKYENNIFCYVGGLSVWQCFPETVALYKQIEKRLPNTLFKVLTADQIKARSILEYYSVENFEVKYIKPEHLMDELAPCKYGFIVRDESPVNYVATPTKLSNYMAAGLIPIVSNTVSFFKEILRKTKNAVVLNGKDDVEKVLTIASREIKTDDIYTDFSNLFHHFYNNETHISNIAKLIQNIKL